MSRYLAAWTLVVLGGPGGCASQPVVDVPVWGA